jgi:hypothetical protein
MHGRRCPSTRPLASSAALPGRRIRATLTIVWMSFSPYRVYLLSLLHPLFQQVLIHGQAERLVIGEPFSLVRIWVCCWPPTAVPSVSCRTWSFGFARGKNALGHASGSGSTEHAGGRGSTWARLCWLCRLLPAGSRPRRGPASRLREPQQRRLRNSALRILSLLKHTDLNPRTSRFRQ